jgi:hypothetical protein
MYNNKINWENNYSKLYWNCGKERLRAKTIHLYKQKKA